MNVREAMYELSAFLISFISMVWRTLSRRS